MPAIVLCALEFERQGLRRAGVALPIECCGPGPEAVTEWGRRAGALAGPVVLAGLAGGLAPDRPAGSAWVVTEVRDESGTRWHPTLRGGAAPRCRITSTPAVVGSVAAKRDLAKQRDADLVDLESCAFALDATRRGWAWAIVRGVGDDFATGLPAGIGAWVDARGRTRPAAVISALCRRPTLAPALLDLRRTGTAALRAVAGRVGELVADGAARGPIE